MVVRRGYLSTRFEGMRLVVPPRRGAVHEYDVEGELVRRLGDVPGRRVVRQPLCHGFKPDVLVYWGNNLTIVELKRWYVDVYALNQLTAYFDHWFEHLITDLPRDWTLYGVLAAPSIDPDLELPTWCSFQRLDVVDARQAAA